LRGACRINLLFVAERDGFQRENCFAGLIHRFDLFLETSRGGYRAEASQVVYNNACASNWASTDASNKGSGLDLACADSDSIGVARTTNRADIDVVAASGDLDAGLMAYRELLKAGGVNERIKSNCCVEVARRVAKK